jgi:hypothetical protein
MDKPLTRKRIVWNLGVTALGCFVIFTLFQLERGIGGTVDETCDPKYPGFFVSAVAPTYFWDKQVGHFAARAAAPFVPPSIEFKKQAVAAKLAASKELATIQEVRAAIATPDDPVTKRIAELRAEADRLEEQQGYDTLDGWAASVAEEGRQYALRCLSRARSELAKR